jgi:hypothetical protein
MVMLPVAGLVLTNVQTMLSPAARTMVAVPPLRLVLVPEDGVQLMLASVQPGTWVSVKA